jgi:hypothetical protein
MSQSTAQDYWDKFCEGTFNLGTGQRVGTNSPDNDQRAQIILVNAWIMYAQGKSPEIILDSLDFMSKQVLFKNKKDDKAQAIMKDFCFNSKYRILLDSLRKDVSASKRFAKSAETKLNQKIFELTSSLPAYLKHKEPCAGIEITVKPDNSLEIVIKVKDCRADAEIDDHGYQRGQLGYPDIYQSIIDWYEHDVLAPLGKTMSGEKGNTIVELKGKADGNPVLGDLRFGQYIEIQKGKEYTKLDEFDIPSTEYLEFDIASFIPHSTRSNEYLALSRACLAEPFFDRIGSNISLVVKEYADTGEDFRGVEIKITAKKLLEEYASVELAKQKKQGKKSSVKAEDLKRDFDNKSKGN